MKKRISVKIIIYATIESDLETTEDILNELSSETDYQIGSTDNVRVTDTNLESIEEFTT